MLSGVVHSLFLTAILIWGSIGGPADNRCDGSGYWSGCSVSNSGTQVDISGTDTHPGGPGSPSSPPKAGGGVPAPPPPVECATELCRGGYGVVALPDVTVADLASFIPATPRLSGEPYGIGVVGMPTNLMATASEQRIPGELFDYDVVVRFVPSMYRFDYGDGTVRSLGDGGMSWSQLGQAEFTPTATSHVYRARGGYLAAVTVLYTASVDFGGGWRPVPGYVESTASGYRIRVVEVHTALVDKTCLENPRGPGC